MPKLILMLFRLIIMLQAMEWYVANNLINNEKGMSNEEIYTAKVGGYVNKRVTPKGCDKKERFV